MIAGSPSLAFPSLALALALALALVNNNRRIDAPVHTPYLYISTKRTLGSTLHCMSLTKAAFLRLITPTISLLTPLLRRIQWRQCAHQDVAGLRAFLR